MPIAAFCQSHAFTKNKPITRATDRNILEAFRAREAPSGQTYGDKRFATVEQHGARLSFAPVDMPDAAWAVSGHPPR